MKYKPRFILRNRFVLVVDIVLTIASALGAFVLRLEGYQFYFYLSNAYWLIAVSLVIKPIVYYLFGLPH